MGVGLRLESLEFIVVDFGLTTVLRGLGFRFGVFELRSSPNQLVLEFL